jgi:hypothetical protein
LVFSKPVIFVVPNQIIMQPRFNAFSMIHKALRSMLYHNAMDLQQADFTNVEASLKVIGQTELIVELFDDHAGHEDTNVLPMLKGKNDALVDQFESEHVKDHKLGNAVREGIHQYKNAASGAERIAAGQKIFYAFNDFIAFNLEHMNREEIVLNETLWANYSDPEIMAVNQKIAASVPPEKAVVNFKWMMRACNDMELLNFVRMIRANAPAPVAAMVDQLAEQEIPAERWTVIKEQLEAMPA